MSKKSKADSRRRRNATQSLFRKRQLLVESLESRELLAIDLEIPALTGVTSNLTLKALTGPLRIELLDGNNVIVGQNVGGPNDGVINITRQGAGNLPVDTFGDTISIDLNTLNALNTHAFVGGGLTINFDGGVTPPFPTLLDDSVILTGSNTLNFSLSVITTADIALNSVNLTLDSDKDLLLRSNPTSSADSVNGSAVDPTAVLAFPAAAVSISGGSINARNITIEAKAAKNVTIAAQSAFDGLSFALVVVNSSADVLVSDTASLAASGNFTILAQSTMTTFVGRTPTADGNANDDDRQEDAASAVTVISSSTDVNIGGNSTINVTGAGAVSIISDNIINATTNADGTAGTSDAGITVANVSIVGDTLLTVDNATIQSASGAIDLKAQSNRTASTTATSTARGASRDNNSSNPPTRGEDTLSDPDRNGSTSDRASTSDGDMDFAATIAVGTLRGDTRATINNATVKSTSNNVSQLANAMHNITTLADGASAPDAANSGIRAAVAIQSIDVNSEAIVSGNSSIDGNTVTISGLVAPSSSTLDSKSGPGGTNSTDSDIGIAGSVSIGVTES